MQRPSAIEAGMSDDDYEFPEEDEYQPPRDAAVDDAKQVVMSTFFPPGSKNVFYSRQIEVGLEKAFFHWITKKALNELAEEGELKVLEIAVGQIVAHFYSLPQHRYPRRQINESVALIVEFSQPNFSKALGITGENLFDIAMANLGFRIEKKNVKAWNGNTWEETGQNLDRIVSRDGVFYGVEIKNTLGYIPKDELYSKMAMSAHFGVHPLFVVRDMPRSYIFDVYKAGGFCLLVGDQHYPMMAEGLAQRVRKSLTLPVRVIRELPDTTLSRFEKGHLKLLARGKAV